MFLALAALCLHIIITENFRRLNNSPPNTKYTQRNTKYMPQNAKHPIHPTKYHLPPTHPKAPNTKCKPKNTKCKPKNTKSYVGYDWQNKCLPQYFVVIFCAQTDCTRPPLPTTFCTCFPFFQ